jgi:hypothetical protein
MYSPTKKTGLERTEAKVVDEWRRKLEKQSIMRFQVSCREGSKMN